MKTIAASTLIVTLFVFVSVVYLKVYEAQSGTSLPFLVPYSTAKPSRFPQQWWATEKVLNPDELKDDQVLRAIFAKANLLAPTPTPKLTPFSPSSCASDTNQDPEAIHTGAEDWDCDGVCNRLDNCTLVYNPDQKDINKDGYGDACDPSSVPKTFKDIRCDLDADGIPDAEDNCPGACNPNQRDSNHNGIGDACDGKKSLVDRVVKCKKQKPLNVKKRTYGKAKE